ncbi:MAG: carbohydrate kinase family protein [Oscillospiraceae bacterium]
MFDVTALGEMLIDFTMQGRNEQGQRIFAQNAGGAPANVMAAMAKLGAKTAFIGKAGNDMHGRFLKETLDNCGIDSTGFILSDDYFTTLAFVDVKENGEREFSFARNHGADKMLSIKDLPLETISNSHILHIGSISLTAEPCRSATMCAVREAKRANCVISYDPNYRASLWSGKQEAVSQMRSMLKYADLVKISEEETELMTDESDYEKAAEALLRQGVKVAVITLGKLGAYVRTSDGGQIVKGFRNKALDATGAGDAFWGGFLYQFCRCGKLPEEVSVSETASFADFGNAVASVCVESYGAIPAMPTMEQVIEKMQEERQE